MHLQVEFTSYQKALEIGLEIFGEQHPFMATILSNIAATRSNFNDIQGALEFAQKALKIRCELLGDRHPHTAGTLFTIATIFYRSGKSHEALPYAEKSFAIHKEILGYNHAATASSIVMLSMVLSATGNREDAFQLVDDALKDMPHQHPKYNELKRQRQRLLTEPLRPGFRQPSTKRKKERRPEVVILNKEPRSFTKKLF